MHMFDDIVRHSLSTLAAEALNGSWNGRRERELISLYAFGYLLQEVRSDGPLFDPTQIGIEFPVPQLAPKMGQTNLVPDNSSL